MKEKPSEIKGTEVVKEVKYLGITVTDNRNCFNKQKKIIYNRKSKKNGTPNLPSDRTNCHKIIIGKAYWKGIVLPILLYETNVIAYTKKEIDQLQRIENSVHRHILVAPRYAQTATLRGETGATAMEERIMEGQIKHIEHIQGPKGKVMLRRIMQQE